MILEACCGSPDRVKDAAERGANRIELCTALEMDGLTPPSKWLVDARRSYPNLRIHVLIRPRVGDFCYSAAELDLMCSQVDEVLRLGADGIAVGCLTPSGSVDKEAMKRIMAIVQDCNRPISVTFHRAFDFCRKPMRAMKDIIALGCDRILTSGQAPTAMEGVPLLRRLVRAARGRIIIMPCAGITQDKLAHLAQATGATEFHGSRIMDG